MDNLTLQEKIDLSNQLVDEYLDEANVSAMGISAVTGAIATAQNVGHDAVRIANWFKKKKQDRDKARQLAARQKDDAQKLKQQQQMA